LFAQRLRRPLHPVQAINSANAEDAGSHPGESSRSKGEHDLMDPKTKKALKTAKSVQLKSGKNAEVVSPTSLNEEALQFIRAYKKSRPKQ
jgi:hypothetical protein